tara:strand:+ start:579 stop:1037 length:459 start_codon:yes stop_codon:yes gene_type:complete
MSTPNEKFADHRFQFSSPGLGKTGQYQMSGIPFTSASIVVPNVESPFVAPAAEIKFPYVTKFITIVNEHSGSSAKLRVGFSALGITGSAGGNDTGENYLILDNGESYTGEFRVSSVFLVGHESPTTASVIAGMTGINASSLLTNWSGTSGVG